MIVYFDWYRCTDVLVFCLMIAHFDWCRWPLCRRCLVYITEQTEKQYEGREGGFSGAILGNPTNPVGNILKRKKTGLIIMTIQGEV